MIARWKPRTDRFRQISGHNDFYKPPLLLYSFAFERLLKIALYLRKWATDGERPDGRDIRRHNHRIVSIHQELLASCAHGPRPEVNGVCRVLVDEDRAWLEADPLFEHFIRTLDAFAKKAWYSHLDRALGLKANDKNPTDLATDLVNAVAKARDIRPHAVPSDSLDQYYQAVSREVMAIARRYYRAIVRLMWYGYMGPEGSRMSAGPIGDAFSVKDGELRHHPAFADAARR